MNRSWTLYTQPDGCGTLGPGQSLRLHPRPRLSTTACPTCYCNLRMKKITSILLSLVLCFSMSANVFASEISTEQEPVSVITVADENGKDVEYELYNNSITNIPIYAAKEGDTSRALTEVATLTIGIGDGFAAFTFTPSNVGIALLTVGFTGDFTTYLSGIKYGYNSYIIPVLSGTVSASSKGTGSLSGTYSVIGYESSSILQAFNW